MRWLSRFRDPDYLGKMLAGITFYVPGAYLVGLSTAQLLGLVLLLQAARIAMDADADFEQKRAPDLTTGG